MRIKRERTRGWRMPTNAVYVGRPPRGKSKDGKLFDVKEYGREEAIELYEAWLEDRIREDPHFLDELKGKDLACWCKLDQPCHADILIKRLEAIP